MTTPANYQPPDVEAFPAIEGYKPGVNYCWVPAEIISLFREGQYKLTPGECVNNGVSYFLMAKGDPLPGIFPSQTAPVVSVWIPDEQSEPEEVPSLDPPVQSLDPPAPAASEPPVVVIGPE